MNIISEMFVICASVFICWELNSIIYSPRFFIEYILNIFFRIFFNLVGLVLPFLLVIDRKNICSEYPLVVLVSFVCLGILFQVITWMKCRKDKNFVFKKKKAKTTFG